jgi:hypothetical protein
MKKGFSNPENRLVLVGMSEHIDRVKTVFSESFYGPPNEFMYFDKEIAPGLLFVSFFFSRYFLCLMLFALGNNIFFSFLLFFLYLRPLFGGFVGFRKKL